MFNKLKESLNVFIHKKEDLDQIDFSNTKNLKFIIVSEDKKVISSCIKAIMSETKHLDISEDNITIIITSQRMIKN